MLEHLTADLERINNKYHMQSEPFNAFARMAYHGWECDPATGYDDGRMAEELLGEYRKILGEIPLCL